MSHWLDPDGPWRLQLSHLNGLFKLPMVSRHQFILYIPDTLQKHLFTFVYTSINHHSNTETCFFFSILWFRAWNIRIDPNPLNPWLSIGSWRTGFDPFYSPWKKWHDWLTRPYISQFYRIFPSLNLDGTWWHHFPCSTGYDGFSGHFLAPKGDESTAERAAAWAAAEESLKSLKREDRALGVWRSNMEGSKRGAKTGKDGKP